MRHKKILAALLVLLSVLTVFSFSASALSWDGSSAGGSTNAVNGSATGYVIRATNDSNCVVGYRFSVVNSSGGMKVNKVIDVFRNTSNGNNAYSTSAKFSVKYNKKQLIANKNAKLTTTLNTTNCIKESAIGFATALPNPSGVETWQAYEANINKVLSKLGVGTTSNMVYGDKVIIEPLFDICLAGEYQALTVSEIAYCGRSVKGGSSDGGKSNGTSSTWGFISNYTNRIWPNKLYTPDGQGLWTSASTIASSTKATFNTILTKGYGAGIAYNETANLTYTIKFNGNGSTGGSTASMSMVKDVSKNLTANGFTRTGYTFKNWNKKTDGSGTSYKNKQSVKNLTNTQGATVNLYAQWKPNTYTISFNGNGKTGGSTASMSMTYDTAKNLTANGFTKTGHSFNGWNTKSNGSGTSYKNKQSVKNLTSANGATITLYARWTPIKYTVKYDANGGSGAPGNQTKTYGVALTLSSTKPTRTGYTFSKWNTKADGTGTNYNSGAKYTGNANLTLYAVWTPITYTVTYNANGGSGAPGNQTKTYGVALTLSSTKPTRIGYTFSKWNTKADGTGTNYNSGAKYTGNANLTLYAVWTPITYTVTYNANRGSGAPGNQTKNHGVDLTLSSIRPTRTGHTFVKWNTKADGSGANYNSGAKYTGNANLTLYAVWTPNKYTVKYDANGGSGAPGNQTKNHGVDLTLSSTKPTRTGYTFSKWNTKADGTGTNYNSGAKYTGNANLTLYAVWTPIKYTVKYDANGGSGAPGNQTKTYGVALTLSSTKPTRTGYTFVKWNTKSDGTGTNYNSGSQYTGNANLTLYAQWKEERKLSLESITPNSSYREDTEVITSFNLVNSGTKNCVPSENVSVLFKVYKDSTVIKTITETQVVVPANDKNLLYFKWTVPKNIGSSTIYISGEIIENGMSYGLVKRSYPTCKYTVSSTPDTQYEISAPSGFTVPGVPTEKNDIATWNEWSYADGVFKKTSYGIGFSSDKPKITPAASANAAFNNGLWTMKSGYGVEMALVNGIKSVSGYAMPNADSYTLSQYAVAKFPEFSYLTSINKYRTLELASNRWIFRQNGSYGRLHFTPLWYPDGNYTATVEQSDLWTPAGMITRRVNTNTVIIKGSAYDDWYIS